MLPCFGISSAQTFFDSGIKYTVTSATAPFTVKVSAIGCTSCTGADITIPETVTYLGTTYTVTAIGSSAFYETYIVSISLPKTIKTIESGAFVEDNFLTSVTISAPSELTSIGTYAFEYCANLTSFTIPNSVTTIGNYAFNNCIHLVIPSLPSSLVTIGDYAFNNTKLGSAIIIPNSVTTIGVGAFYGCTDLASVTLPNTLTTLNNEVFFGCTALTSITIPSTVTSVGPHAFNDCTALTSVTCLATTVPAINPNAFQGVNTTVIPLYVPFGTGTAYDATAVWTDFIINQLAYSGPIVPGQVGINTVNPLTTLDVVHKTPASPANDAGIAFPQVSNLPSSGVQAGQMVYNITDNYLYFFNGTTWSPIREVPIPALGSIKYSILANDHLGWYKLDGRAVTTLGTTQQTNAAAINISGSLPNAESHVLKDNGTNPVFQTGGSDTVILTQGQMPSGVTGSGTTSSDGSHTHSFDDAYEDDQRNAVNGNEGLGSGNGGTNRTSSAEIHNHAYSFNLGDDTPISVEDAFLTVNVFIFLGL